MSGVGGIWRALRLGEHLLTGALLSAIFVPAGKIVAAVQRHEQLICWWHRRLCRILGVEIAVEGRPLKDTGVLVANHVSWIDIPVLGSLATTTFLSKSEVRHWPLVGWLAARSGTLFIDRGGHQSRVISDRIKDHARRGRCVTLFPEATTTDGRSVRAFFARLMAPAIDEALPVQPVALRYANAAGEADDHAPFIGNEGFLHHLWRVLQLGHLRVEVTFCPPLARPYASRRVLADTARLAIVEALARGSRARSAIPCSATQLVNESA